MAQRYSVVLAHGRAAAFEIPAIESSQWAQALLFSLRRVGSPYADTVDVDYAYFGDIWRPDVRNEFPVFRTTDRSRVTLDAETGQISVTRPTPRPGALGDVAARADALLPDWALGRMLRPIIPDVFQYLENAEYRTGTNARLVEKCVTREAQVLVGFSMGSIVGYEVLRKPAADFPVRSFITVGSPIGLGPVNRPLRRLASADNQAAVKAKKLPKADVTPFPPDLRLWLNIWNENDVATGIHGEDLAAMFPDPESDRRRTIQSGQNFGLAPSPSNLLAAHNALDYLSSLAMGIALHAALLDLEAGGAG